MEYDEIPSVPTVAEVAKTEATRQTIILLFGIAGVVVSVYVQRKMSDPDVMSTLKMATALYVKRWADRQADRFTRLASHMANVYNGEKL